MGSRRWNGASARRVSAALDIRPPLHRADILVIRSAPEKVVTAHPSDAARAVVWGVPSRAAPSMMFPLQLYSYVTSARAGQSLRHAASSNM